MALYIPHSIFHLARLLYVRPETFGPYYVYFMACIRRLLLNLFCVLNFNSFFHGIEIMWTECDCVWYGMSRDHPWTATRYSDHNNHFWFQCTMIRFVHHNSGLYVEETQRDVVDGIHLPHNREQCRAVVKKKKGGGRSIIRREILD